MGAFTGAQIKFIIGKDINLKHAQIFKGPKLCKNYDDVCLEHVDELPDRAKVTLSLLLLASQ